jgi:hypothetical protein
MIGLERAAIAPIDKTVDLTDSLGAGSGGEAKAPEDRVLTEVFRRTGGFEYPSRNGAVYVA